MAPEMLQVNSIFDWHIDNWSLGVILHQMLTGRMPFDPFQGNRQLARQIVLKDIDFGEYIWDGISIEAVDLVQNLLIKDPEHREEIDMVLVNSWIKDTSVEERVFKCKSK